MTGVITSFSAERTDLSAEKSLENIKAVLSLYLIPEKLSFVDMGWRDVEDSSHKILMTYIVYDCKIVGRLSIRNYISFARNSPIDGLYEGVSAYKVAVAGELATVGQVLEEVWGK